MENDKKDIKIAYDRIQSTINNLNEERRKIDLEKINIMKRYQELENKKTALMNEKQNLNYAKTNIDLNVKAVDNMKTNYVMPNNNINSKSNQNLKYNTYNNFYSNKAESKFNADEYFNNLMKSMKNNN